VRTTLDIDERALTAARAKAAADHTSIGDAVSRLVLAGLGTAPPRPEGFPVFSAPPGHAITDQMVAEHRDDS
jgi:hypothetical protein